MPGRNMVLSAVTLAALASLPLLAQQSTGTPGAPSAPQTTSGNHADPTAATPGQSNEGRRNQQTPAQPDQGASHGGTSAVVPVPHTASAPEVANAQLRPVATELVNKLDTKNAKAGDEVVLKTTEQATIADGIVLPKGTRITGQVVAAKAHDGSNKNAQVTLVFTKAELKDGQTMPIRSVLQSVSAADSGDTGNSPTSPAGTMSASGGGGTAPMAGGTPAGGVQGSTGASGVSGNQSAQSGMAASGPGTAGANGAPAVGTVVAQQGNVQIKITSIPGVLLEANADGQPFSNASGGLIGAGQNVHLDGGTRVDLAIADANGKAASR